MARTVYHEPNSIVQGETVSFTKNLADYPASDGWYLLYAMRGNGQEIGFSSSASVDDHVVLVAATETATWLPGDYQLEGFAVDTDGTKKQIYLSSVSVTPNLSTAAGDIDMRTHAQKMLASIEIELEKCAQNILLETDVEGTRIVRERRTELLKIRQAYIQERRGEVAAERARAGKPTGRKIRTQFCITAPGAVGIRQGSVFDTQFP